MNCTVDPADSLHKIRLFQNLSPKHLSQLSQSLHYRCLPGKHNLFCQEHLGESIYILLDGSVRVCIEEPDGKDVLLAICGEGEILGEISAIDGQGHSATVTTLEPTHFLWIDCATFRHYLQAIPALAYNLAEVLVQRLRRSTAQTHALAHLDVSGRVAYQLLTFARDYGKPALADETPLTDCAAPTTDYAAAADDCPAHILKAAMPLPTSAAITIPLQLRQGDLAALVGATRESVNKALRVYLRSGVITINDYRITIVNPAVLQRQLR